MINPNDSAHPYEGNGLPGTTGLTKREHFAAMAMQGLLANSNGAINEHGMRVHSPESISGLALLHADALIEALNN